MKYLISKKDKTLKGRVKLTASKSESNRVLIIQALCQEPFQINNLAEAEDTKTLLKLLSSSKDILDVGPAGTTMRFLTAYLANKENSEKIITGSERMLERPIAILTDSLNKLGAEISYLKKEGFPPLKIKGKKLTGNEISIDGSISSQYITALLLIAPTLPNGLNLQLTGKITSRPYINMTLKMLEYFGVNALWENNIIEIKPQSYHAKEYTIEGDWSSASYWYTVAAFSDEVDFTLTGLNENSLQGDSVIATIMEEFGIKTNYLNNKIHLSKTNKTCNSFSFDFSDCPDIAQTVAVICSGLNIPAKLMGLESLKIKETDRVQALINELSKMGANISESENDTLVIQSGHSLKSGVHIETYKDHRMAMAFAPLSMITENIIITDPAVVSKSYPAFWDDLSSFGFDISQLFTTDITDKGQD